MGSPSISVHIAGEIQFGSLTTATNQEVAENFPVGIGIGVNDDVPYAESRRLTYVKGAYGNPLSLRHILLSPPVKPAAPRILFQKLVNPVQRTSWSPTDNQQVTAFGPDNKLFFRQPGYRLFTQHLPGKSVLTHNNPVFIHTGNIFYYTKRRPGYFLEITCQFLSRIGLRLNRITRYDNCIYCFPLFCKNKFSCLQWQSHKNKYYS